ncbi:MAG: kelch repeat-containing protein [Tepidisphaeraceae bacterium]
MKPRHSNSARFVDELEARRLFCYQHAIAAVRAAALEVVAVPTVSLTATDSSASESGDRGTFRLSRTGDTSAALAVNILYGGGASNGVDYPLFNTPYTIPAGKAFVDIDINPTNDAIPELLETVAWVLQPSAAYTIDAASASASIKLADNDLTDVTPIVRLSVIDSTLNESGDAGIFRFTRTGSTASPLVLDVTLGGSAKNGIDYQTIATPITILAGQSTRDYVIKPIDDALVEGTETVTWEVKQSTAYAAPTGSTYMTIKLEDNDSAVALPSVSVSAIDNSASESGDTGTFRVTRTGPTTSALTVNFGLSGSATEGSDYTAIVKSVTIPAGQSFVDVNVKPIDDNAVETVETIVLAVNSSSTYMLGTASATVNLADNDVAPGLPTVSIAAIDAAASEGGDTGTFRIARTGATTAALAVSVSIAGTASIGSDYSATRTTPITIPAGQSFVDVVVTPIDDASVEGTESIVWQLSTGSTYMLGTRSATITLTDNDKATTSITWIAKASSPQARTEGWGEFIAGKLYVFGGYVDSTYRPVKTGHAFDPVTNTWTRVADAPLELTHAGTAADNRYLYVAGGYPPGAQGPTGPQAFATNQVFRYDTQTNTWSTLPSLPAARGSGRLAMVGRKLYYFGGSTASRADVADMWSLDLDNTAAGWTTRASMPAPRNHFGSAVVNGMIYAVAGQTLQDANSVFHNEVYRYDPTSNAWTTVAPIVSPARSHANASTFTHNGRIYVMGGEAANGVALADVDVYNPATNSWSSLNNLPRAITAGVAVSAGNYVLFSTGYRGIFTGETWTGVLS